VRGSTVSNKTMNRGESMEEEKNKKKHSSTELQRSMMKHGPEGGGGANLKALPSLKKTKRVGGRHIDFSEKDLGSAREAAKRDEERNWKQVTPV